MCISPLLNASVGNSACHFERQLLTLIPRSERASVSGTSGRGARLSSTPTCLMCLVQGPPHTIPLKGATAQRTEFVLNLLRNRANRQGRVCRCASHLQNLLAPCSDLRLCGLCDVALSSNCTCGLVPRRSTFQCRAIGVRFSTTLLPLTPRPRPPTNSIHHPKLSCALKLWPWPSADAHVLPNLPHEHSSLRFWHLLLRHRSFPSVL
jgi:hypothetical protein